MDHRDGRMEAGQQTLEELSRAVGGDPFVPFGAKNGARNKKEKDKQYRKSMARVSVSARVVVAYYSSKTGFYSATIIL